MKYLIGTRLLCNVVIFLSASKRLPEFQGYMEKTFPGQPKPRRVVPHPRRESLKSDLEIEWKKVAPKTTGTVQIKMIKGPKVKYVDRCTRVSI